MRIDSRLGLRILFGFIFVSLAVYTAWASARQPVWEWGGPLRTPAMAAHVLLHLQRLGRDEPVASMLTTRHA